ncbi:unnamed protein product [Urochloa humidicola]
MPPPPPPPTGYPPLPGRRRSRAASPPSPANPPPPPGRRRPPSLPSTARQHGDLDAGDPGKPETIKLRRLDHPPRAAATSPPAAPPTPHPSSLDILPARRGGSGGANLLMKMETVWGGRWSPTWAGRLTFCSVGPNSFLLKRQRLKASDEPLLVPASEPRTAASRPPRRRNGMVRQPLRLGIEFFLDS